MIARARLVFCDPGTNAAAPRGLDELLTEFPSLEIAIARDKSHAGDVSIDASAWRSLKCDLYAFDRRVGSLADEENDQGTLDIRGQPSTGAATALEILTRYQRMIARRNAASRGALFDRVFARHRALHDRTKPLVRADYDHALDVWHWMLRLDPDAGFAAQVAAIFHDVERLASEADVRIEQHAADYPAFKDAHARGSAAMTAAVLDELEVNEATRTMTLALITDHERPPSARAGAAASSAHAHALTVLNDADALSFFSLNSPGFVDYYGLEHAEKKIAYTLSRMSPRARGRLGRVRLRSDVAHMLLVALAAERGDSRGAE